MNRLTPLTLLLALTLFATSCGGGRSESLFPSDVMTRAEKALETKIDTLGIVSPTDSLRFVDVTAEEREAMTYLYAYMSLPDLMDHSIAYHLDNVRVTLRAREEMPWGKEVPGALFRAFVLPKRVNNEVLDDFRTTYYDELSALVDTMTMEQAVLALNRWAHKHITYQPSDGRTSSPIATLRNALGRCGEQSTFVVAVLRTVGIPARQVYTPRWAHTDDNHAWVEAWVDGKWHYLGASEPAPVLDNAWFDAPVMRAMMLHTTAFGDYDGDEEVLSKNDCFTELNVTPNYIRTAPMTVRIVDEAGKPVEGATVTYRIYNYAELYPLVTRTTDERGEAMTNLGLGDVVIFASKGSDRVAMEKMTNKEGGSTLELTLRPLDTIPAEQHLRLTPPVEQTPEVRYTEAQAAENARLLAEEDAVREAYTATFPTAEQATALADELGAMGEDRTLLLDLFPKSRGYHATIERFLRNAAESGRLHHALLLLSSLTEKDLHDVSITALEQVLDRDLTDADWQEPMIYCPRAMDREPIAPQQPELDLICEQILGNEELSREERVARILERVGQLSYDKQYNPLNLPMTPASTWILQRGNQRSLTVLLIRLLRTAKVPAWFDFGNSVVRYRDDEGREQVIPYLKEEKEAAADCPLQLTYEQGSNTVRTPHYTSHFTVGYFDPAGGQMSTYYFDDMVPYTDLQGKSLLYPDNFLLTGSRLADGTVLASIRRMSCGKPMAIDFDREEGALAVIGNFDSESLYQDLAGEERSLLSTTGRGYYLLVLARDAHEPSDHILRDLGAIADGSGKLPIPTVVLTPQAPSETLHSLLPGAAWGIDTQRLDKALAEGLERSLPLDYPVVIVADTFNRVVYFHQGYTIGIGGQIADVLSRL